MKVFRVVMLALLAIAPGCGPGLCAGGDCGFPASSQVRAVTFSVSPERTDQATLTWSDAVGSATVSQTVSLYSGNNATCAGPPAHQFEVAGNATSATWNRFSGGLTGLIRFSVSPSNGDAALGAVPCSGSVFLRNGVVSVVGTSSGAQVGTVDPTDPATLFADLNSDGVKDIIVPDPSYDGRGSISVSLSVGGSLHNRTLVQFFGQAGDGLGSTMKVEDLTGDGIADIFSATNSKIFIINGSSTLPTSATVGVDWGWRYYSTFATHSLSTGSCSWDDYLPGDMNGDGLNEIVLCAANYSLPVASAGTVVVIPTGALLPASGDIEALAGVRFYTGNSTYSGLGGFRGTGPVMADITGDGRDDLLIPNWADNYFGVVPGAATLPASGQVSAVGRMWTSSDFGLGVLTVVADINNDGISDWILEGDATVYVFLGQTTLPANGTVNVRASRAYTGSTPYLTMHDLNGDGIDEPMFADANASPGGITQAGSLYVFLGGALPASGNLSAISHRRYNGDFAGDLFGSSSGWYFDFPDVNSDGYDDILFSNGNPDVNGSNSGSAFLILGGSTLPASGAISTVGRRYNGAIANDSLAITAVGDMTGDGIPEVVFYTGAGQNLHIIQPSPTLPATGTITSVATRTYAIGGLELSLSFDLEDINGDGYQDLMVGVNSSPGYSGDGGVCILAGGATLPASSNLVSAVSKCVFAQVDDAILRHTEVKNLSSTLFKDFILNRLDSTLATSTLELLVGAGSFTSSEKRYGTQVSWGDPDAPIVYQQTEDLDGDGALELIYFQPEASTSGLTQNGAIHVIPGGYLYTAP